MMWQDKLAGHLCHAERPCIVVVGPTASGKTALSLNIASWVAEHGGSWHGAEVVNADSRQLYLYLTIGTAKITPQEMGKVQHHLLNVLDPKEEATVGWYKQKALLVINDILERRFVPVLVGGSMLYVSSVLDGLLPLPRADRALREALAEEYARDSGMTLYRRLREVDPVTAAVVHPHNEPSVIRALEIYASTGGKPSRRKRRMLLPYDFLVFGMHWPRNQLCQRIDERTEKLLQSGWIEEVRELLQRGYAPDDPGMKSTGYREIGLGLGLGLRTEEIIRRYGECIAAKTRQYAKRQMTWWRHDKRIHWISS